MVNFKKEQKGAFALVLLTAVFATYGIFARYFNVGFQLFQQVALRAISAFIIGSIIFAKDLDYSKLRKISTKEWGLLVFRAIALYVLGIALVTQAFILSKYGVVSLINVLPMVAVLGVVLFKERLTLSKIFLILLSFLGVSLIVVNDINHLFNWGAGEVLALIATFFFALNYVSQKWHSKLLNEKEITQIVLFVSFILTALASLILGEGMPIIHINFEIVIAIVIVGLFNVLGLWLANYGFQHVKVIVANNILNLRALFAILIGYFLYQEALTFKEIVGGLIIVASVLAINKTERGNR